MMRLPGTNVLYAPPDVCEMARKRGANCGPGTLAAYLRVSVRKALELLGGDNWPGYTNIKPLLKALESVGRPHRSISIKDNKVPPGLPDQYLLFIQIEGPWEKHWQEAYNHTHWCMVRRVAPMKFTVFDINANGGKGGWSHLLRWESKILPLIYPDNATGAHIRNIIVPKEKRG